jgi:hypothetical protein
MSILFTTLMNTSTWWKQTPDDLIHFVWPKWTSTHPHTMPNGWYACGQNTMYVDKKTQFHCIPVPQLTMVVSYVLNHSRASTWHSSHYGSCREGSHMSAFSWGRGALKGVRCSQTSGECKSTGTSPCINNYLFISLVFPLSSKRNIYMGTWEYIKFGELPQHNALWYFRWGRSLKIHIEIKRALFR